jgi:hypothetical protein
MQRSRRDGADLVAHAARLVRFFGSPLRGRFAGAPLAPIVFSWLAGRGAEATRLEVDGDEPAAEIRRRLGVALGDPRLFTERLIVR